MSDQRTAAGSAADGAVAEAFELGRAQMLMACDSAAAPELWRGGVVVSAH